MDAPDNHRSPGYQPMRRTSKVAESIARDIVHDITRQGLGPGAKLPLEKEMLERYGVGRGSLREALRLLELQGVLQVRQGSGGGPVVSATGSRDFGSATTLYYHLHGATIRQLLEARMFIEPAMARLAAGRPAERRTALKDYFSEVTQASADTWMPKTTDFHERVAEITGNDVIGLIGTSLKTIYSSRLGEISFSTSMRKKIRADHENIGDAILAADADAAEQLMREHMQRTVAAISQQYRGLLDEVIDWGT